MMAITLPHLCDGAEADWLTGTRPAYRTTRSTGPRKGS
jgi:hypothetical protein